MKVGDLIKLPDDEAKYAIVMKVIAHGKDPNMPTGDIAVMVMQEWGEDWWDADYCEVINEMGS